MSCFVLCVNSIFRLGDRVGRCLGDRVVEWRLGWSCRRVYSGFVCVVGGGVWLAV